MHVVALKPPLSPLSSFLLFHRELDNDIKHVITRYVYVHHGTHQSIMQLSLTLYIYIAHLCHINSAAAPGLDLSLLTQYLVPYEVAKGEEDVAWMFDELLEELTQDLHADMEKKGTE